MKTTILLLVCIIALANAGAPASSAPPASAPSVSSAPSAQFTIKQTKLNGWKNDKGSFSVWEVELSNVCGSCVRDVTISADANFSIRGPTDVWGIVSTVPNKYHLPDYITEHGLKVGETFKFGYINSNENSATFSAFGQSFNCA